MIGSFFNSNTRLFGRLLISGLLSLGILILIEIISFNHNVYFDLTPGKIHTFSEQTRQILKSLDKDIEFTGFYRIGERAEMRDFFERLCYYSPKLKYRLFDLDRNPGKAKLYGISNTQTVIECNGNRRVIGFPTEERVVNAILRLAQGVVKTVYFTTGHDENHEYSELKSGLETENWRFGDVQLLEYKDIPVDETVIVIARPQRDFLDDEILVIEKYLQRGGKVVILLEPFVTLPRIESFLKDHGVIAGNGIVVDQQSRLSGGDYLTPIISERFRCDLTQGLEPSSKFIFPTVRPLSVAQNEIPGITVQPFLRSSTNSWSKDDLEDVKKGNVDFKEGVDTPGPLNVAIWVRIKGEKEDTEGELICFADSDFIADTYYNLFSNKDLFLNTLGWLAKEKDLISIRSKKMEFPFHYLSLNQSRMLFWISIIGLPLMSLSGMVEIPRL
ncbi:putative ABC-type uncharacterized transport system involved in gliding motility auxiliary component-like [uncultured Desulfobacterium sp.]|uniref:Putative ABC-type uncharacterized transport system involved in gliding motility auxiliary component-like n=1 Tax=uncultured Desulfobacterium sp. TaxID=201089 RepID=A0A445MYA1_9BACT|nr:putative ABC-type uncharacterized transport system involved in gliding motility auxiliary component-like [uncultured Desulfobacterium sp.]